MLLEINNLNVAYGPFEVIHDVSLSVDSNGIVTVLGPNGAGKTTLLKAISGMIPVKSGSIVFNGENITNMKPHLISREGLVHVPEGRQCFTELTVFQNLMIAGRAEHARSKRDESLELMHELFPRLMERAKQQAGTLSGGERQMLCIAMGFMNNPKLLMIDEPSQGLAPILVLELFERIKEICSTYDVAILFVEQQARSGLRIAKRGSLLIEGRIVYEDAVENIIKSDEVKKHYFTL